jgi:5-methylcytosine-specific restriction enzyme subunit McrC
MKTSTEPITLKEYVPVRIPASKISREDGKRLWQEFGEKITVAEPSFKNDDQWELTSQGWVGFIPFSEQLGLYLKPKVPLKNLFGMWEYAYRLKSFQILPDLYQCESLQEFYEQLAGVLAKRILDRSRKGYYRAYMSRTEDLSFLKGHLDLHQMMNKPWEPRPRCNYQENTADVEENQILAWTLYAILRSGFCTERVLPVLRNCHRNLGQVASLQPFYPIDCLGRIYNRLNQDYQPLHALCRFFLENTGPSYEVGDHTMLPFLVNMAGLFELFVAEWLRVNLPPEFELNSQERLEIDKKGEVFFKIDLVIYEAVSKRPVCVLDTKYKRSEKSPSSDDIAQVGFYSMAKKCHEAILVYPDRLLQPMDETVNDIRIRTTTFSLDDDLEKSGEKFLKDLLLHHASIEGEI